jgi:hypothetical protein
MQKYLNFFSDKDDILLESSELLLINSEDQENLLLIDPKTLGILENYTVKPSIISNKNSKLKVRRQAPKKLFNGFSEIWSHYRLSSRKDYI